ncbi:hypothetical protein [Natronococcus wangiae]|uniref:hypothetical protein n=1 Tax=Natronococcus wangiae TaxID=3068275 RepID=UPI00273D1409|nr:hypothetical protein [Natronococcus sp. AD5]
MLEAREAIGVVLDREAGKLVLVILLGWWMINAGATDWIGFQGVFRVLHEWLVALTRLAGFALYYGGVLALLVKIVYEAVTAAESR